MGMRELGDELAGRFEALNWFMLDLADELVASGCIDKQRLLDRLRDEGELTDQVEYLRIAQQHLSRMIDRFAEDGPAGGRRPGA